MPQSQFIPARSSRHRTAVIALFRALLQEGRQIPLPQDVLRNGKSPVPALIKRGFERNKTEVSPRLIFAAMSAGYKFITLFQNARDPTSKEHGEILTYLRDQKEMADRAERGQPKREKREKRERRPDYKPVLQRISGPNEPPEYITPRYPRPRDSFTGHRKVPIPVVANSQTFLRVKYPQPQMLSDYIRTKGKKRIKLIDRLNDIEGGGHALAAQEDAWDKLVDKTLSASGGQPEGDYLDPRKTYQRTVHDDWHNASTMLNRQKEEEIAKSRAFVKAAAAEEAMLEKEKAEADKAGFRITLTKEERIQRYLKKRQQRKMRRQGRWTRVRTQRWQRRFIGLKPTPIQVKE